MILSQKSGEAKKVLAIMKKQVEGTWMTIS